MTLQLSGKQLGPISKSIKFFKSKTSGYWANLGKSQMLELFHEAAERVPAYKEYLQKYKIDHRKIKTLTDFANVPTIDKKHYLNAYPFKKLFWNGNLKKPTTIHSTSGSTGEPTYFQRELEYDLRREIIIENFFRLNKITISEPTLFIITFGMGVWSAGMGIYTASYLAINRNRFPISIVSPGVSKVETLKILKKLAPQYKQVIIAGYPPFVKDVLDDAFREGVNVKKMDLRFVFTGEAFTEEFRDYLLSNTGINNMFTDTMNTYGTSELGATAIETPLAILTRRLAYKNKNIFKELFGNITKTPTVAQYIPPFVNFQCENGELFFTGDCSIPLIKYRSGDNGGIFTYNRLQEVLSNNGINLEEICKKLGIADYKYELPFVYVYERKNLTASIYGILIYPEFIKTAIFNKRLAKHLTGKFMMVTRYGRQQDQYLEINLELKKGAKLNRFFTKYAVKKIVEILSKKSSEYRELSLNIKEKAFPKLKFWPYEYPKYFTPGIKQKWVAKAEAIL